MTAMPRKSVSADVSCRCVPMDGQQSVKAIDGWLACTI